MRRGRIPALLGGTIAALAFMTPAATASTAAGAASMPFNEACREISIGDTGGWAECKIDGTWRLKSVCSAIEGDEYTGWVTTNGSRYVRVYAADCDFNMVDIIVEIR